MERLNYRVLEESGYSGYILKDAPEKVLQFGEGNFLRAFADDFIDILNEKAGFNGKVAVCAPRGNKRGEEINVQEGLYTLLLRGRNKGKMTEQMRVISCLSRCINPVTDFGVLMRCAANPDLRFIISNTTEAGIVYDPTCRLTDAPAGSFPGKLTQLLYERFKYKLPGFIILSCELVDRNGDRLRECVEQYINSWGLPEEFAAWVRQSNTFCSTLVDRIVPGYPKDDAEDIFATLGYKDKLLCTGEIFGTWVIEGDKSILEELHADKGDVPIIVTDNIDLYKKRKVRILNGAHTSMSLAAFLAGCDTVGECMKDPVIRGFISRAVHEEIIPVLDDIDREDLEEFASDVADRFANPFISHSLLSIALNSTAKWKARVMPTVIEYHDRFGTLPKLLTFSFAAYLSFYHRGRELMERGLMGTRDDMDYIINDDRDILKFFYDLRDATAHELAEAVTGNEDLWGTSLKDLDGFAKEVEEYLIKIDEAGIYELMTELVSENKEA